MKQTIWKYQFEISDDIQIKEMPLGAECVHVAAQDGILCMWALVNPNYKDTERSFVIRGTGHVSDLKSFEEVYVGSVQMPPFVWHLFEIR